MSEQTLTYAVFVKIKIDGSWIIASGWKEKYNDVLLIYNSFPPCDLIKARKIVIKTEELDDYLVEEMENVNDGN